MARTCTAAVAAASLLLLSACSDPAGPAVPKENVVDASGGVVTAQNGQVRLEIPAGAVSGETEITVTKATPPADPHLVSGAAYEFGPSGLVFAKPVMLELGYDQASLPANAVEGRLRIFKRVGTGWTLDSEDAVVDPSSNRVRAEITGFSTHAVREDPCATVPISVGSSIDGHIGETDCLVDGSTRAEPFTLEIGTTSAVRVTITSSELSALASLTTPGRDLKANPVLASGSTSFAVLAAPASYQLQAAGQEGSTGSYTLGVESLAMEQRLGCSEAMHVAPPVSGVPQRLNDDSDCIITIRFPSDPSVDGKKTLEEYYYIVIPAGKTVSVTTTATGGAQFTPFPTIFLGGGQVVQTSGSPTAPSKTISYTNSGAAPRRVLLGVSATMKDDGGGMVYTEGTYSLSVSVD